MNRTFILEILLISLLFLLKENCFSQGTISKNGGICIRVDDDQPLDRLKLFSNLFTQNNKFCLAINGTDINGNTEYLGILRQFQNNGHELMDHTPNHRTNYFTGISDTNFYSGKLGVDHINKNKICLAYDIIDTIKIHSAKHFKINITGNNVFSIEPGDFSDIDGADIYAIYIPLLKKIFNVYNIKNQNKNDIDTLNIRSFWDEDVNLNIYNSLEYFKINLEDVIMSSDAMKLLFERSKSLFDSFEFTAPTCWIQPGGGWPRLTKERIKNIAKETKITCSAVYQNTSYMCFNEYNKNKDKQFAMQWGQIEPEKEYFQEMKKIIADAIAKHFLLIASSHFLNNIGDFNSLLTRIDSLLKWCSAKEISIKTYSEWSKLLYYDVSNASENIFPKLNVDLDEDGLPDGYFYQSGFTDGKFDNFDGVQESAGKSFSISKKGSILFIDHMGGIEKGENEFSFYVKGAPDDTIKVIFSFPEYSKLSDIMLRFPAVNSNWTKYSTSQSVTSTKNLIIPDSVSLLDVRISCSNYKSGEVKISGMELRKKSTTDVLPPWNLTAKLNSENNISLKWEKNSMNETGFYIERYSDSTSVFSIIATVPTGTLSYLDKNIKDNSQYKYKVSAFQGAIKSDYSNEVIITSSSNIQNKNFSSGWSMFSFPLVPENRSIKNIFGNSTASPLNIFKFELKTKDGYVLVDSVQDNFSGYWIKLPGAKTVSIKGLLQVDSTEITLNKGYNLLGNPFAKKIALNNLLIKKNDNYYSWPDAVVSGLISSSVYCYRSAGYVILDTLNSWDGFWINSLDNNISLVFDYNREVSAPLKKLSSTKDNGWLANFHIEENGYAEDITSIGCNSNATNDYDPLLDITTAPDPPEKSISIFSLHPEWKNTLNDRLYTDIKSFKNNQRWNMGVIAKQVGDTIKVSWKIQTSPQLASLVLTDYKSNHTINMLSVNSYKFIYSEDDSIVIEAANLLNTANNGSIPHKFELSQNYPNPFNPVTNINFSIDKSGFTKLYIFNILGQLIKVLVDGYKNIGDYKVHFNGENLPSGVYFYRLQTNEYSATKKMIFLK